MSRGPVCERIIALLEEAAVAFEVIEHEAVSSAAEAATVRGTPLELGVKAILFKIDRSFALFAMSGARQMRSSMLRKALGVRRTRFATRRELLDMTGLAPGAVPPFGEPVLPFPLYADPSVLDRESLVFTAGSRTTSIRLATADWRCLAAPTVVAFTGAAAPP
jgi:Ala-tRNA(Pro) deacylase